MKNIKICLFAVAAGAVLLLSACGTSEVSTNAVSEIQTETAEEIPDITADNTADGEIYGNTETLAQMIQKHLGGDHHCHV